MLTTLLGILMIVAIWYIALRIALKTQKWVIKTFLSSVSKRLHPSLYPKKEKQIVIKFKN